MPKRTLQSKQERYERNFRMFMDAVRPGALPAPRSSKSENEPDSPALPLDDELIPQKGSENKVPVLEPVIETQEASNGEPVSEPTVESETTPLLGDTQLPSIDPLILQALGDALEEEGPQYGPEIHDFFSQLWEPLLKKGIPKETKDKIMEQYLIPRNCSLLQAPKLNLEISAAVTDMMRARDEELEAKQNQLGAGLSAISQAITLLMTSDDKYEVIKKLSDGCRIFCDVHSMETQARINMIKPGLAKPLRNLIQEGSRDETLFGSLTEKTKEKKNLGKRGSQIKKKKNQKTMPPQTPVALRRSKSYLDGVAQLDQQQLDYFHATEMELQRQNQIHAAIARMEQTLHAPSLMELQDDLSD